MAGLTLKVGAISASRDAMMASARSVADALLAAQSVSETIPDGILREVEALLGDGSELSFNATDFLRVEQADLAATWAEGLDIAVRFFPAERYGKLVSALASDRELQTSEIHGWPILSVDAATSTVTEGEGVASALPGGGGEP